MGAASGKKAQEAAALQEALAAAEAKVRVPKPPTADGPRATLIVCPLSVLSNWQTQIEEHTAGNLEVIHPSVERIVLIYGRGQEFARSPSDTKVASAYSCVCRL